MPGLAVQNHLRGVERAAGELLQRGAHAGRALLRQAVPHAGTALYPDLL